jgi:hypothetical protein
MNRSVSGLFTCLLTGGRHATMKWKTVSLYKTWHLLDEYRSRGVIPRIEGEYLGLLEQNGIVLQ